MRILIAALLLAIAGVAHADRCETSCTTMAKCKLTTSYNVCVTNCRADGIEKDPDGAAHLDMVAKSSCEALEAQTAPPEGEIDVDYTVPPGYTSSRNGSAILLAPTTPSQKAACHYGLLPARASTGNLETDARNAVLDAVPGFQRGRGEQLVRGTAPAGWPYFWYRTGVQRMNHGVMEYLNAMAMAFPATKGRVNIVFAAGSNVYCQGDDGHFERLFHSLKPRGWKADPEAFKRALAGTWRLTVGNNKLQYAFAKDGRYMDVLHTQTTVVWTETTRTSSGDGSWSTKDGLLILQADRGGTRKLMFRPHEKYVGGRWWRVANKIGEGASDEAVEYDFIPGG